ncbi:MAG: thiamine pyrophosphate-dependent dehydrogenase E1 component subunit alpha [bacterium]|nr:thiamine pyrophosphate-dependent dehydrogenase E1 component subunit alpha [bacterium]MDE0288133.1 thiamine pyrophosphate-dependent dehydrogenase E1 component subunit alpha [bacterium]MDE0438424.1 thiamine pyrophosphate-dependent dehydrogenase E1 component subunit alpha [bacterium]
MTQMSTPLENRLRLQSGRRARFERMCLIRAFETRVQAMFFEGLVHGTTHTCQGQEAVAVGIATAARPTDTVTCTYRGHGHALALGMSPITVLGEIMGRRVGSVGGVGGSMHLCDTSIGLLPTFAIVGAGIPVAAGAALTAQVRGTDDAAIAIFGDGASNIGAFHEGLNLAAIWKLPAVFICENNQYGEYTAIHLTTPVENIADRAVSYGIPGHVVDGQDVDVVAAAVGSALERARAGEGPTLLEMKTYRYAGHSRADTAPYRPKGELERWYERDPVNTYRGRLIEEGELTAEEAEEIEARAARIVAETEASASASDPATVGDMFRHIYAPANG